MAATEIKKKVRIRASVDKVSALLEDHKRVPEWNPLLKRITPPTGAVKAKATMEWEAAPKKPLEVAEAVGPTPETVAGSSEVITWKPGKEYAWRSKDRLVGVTYEGRFVLEAVDNQTVLTATLSYDFPNAVVSLVNRLGFKQLLTRAVTVALSNIDRISTGS